MQGNIQDELLFPHPQKHNLADFYPSSVPPKCFLVCKHPNIKKKCDRYHWPKNSIFPLFFQPQSERQVPFESKLWQGSQTKSEEILKCHCWWLCLCDHSKHSVSNLKPLPKKKRKKKTWRRLCRCASITKFALSKMGRTEMSKNAFHRPQHYRHQNLAQKSLKLDQMLKKT